MAREENSLIIPYRNVVRPLLHGRLFSYSSGVAISVTGMAKAVITATAFVIFGL
jgi:hypothetical protein